MERQRTYIAIDLKSFYASVECIQRELDPMTTNLVVADLSRTEKTICLAVFPSLKQYGISGRARLFEVVQQVKKVNALRQQKAPGHTFAGASFGDNELRAHPELAIDYVVATPQMALYMETSAGIYDVYLKYVAPEDIHVYSIFIDATAYLNSSKLTPREFTMKIILDVLDTTGITATAGIGTNYAAKDKQQAEDAAALEREKRQQQAVLSIKKKFGKNAILKGLSLQEGATARDRNAQIGGHKA